ncbi:MAG: SPFH domain-containing protein [Lachnospiraceae bacterium]
MGLIAAALASGSGVLANQYREFFYCDSMGMDVLVKEGQKHQSGRSTNNKGDENIITNGSRVAVADGQCAIIVDNGKIVEVCAQPDEYIYDTSKEPTIFYGGLGKGIVDSFKKWGERITFGGDTARVQKIYYFNLKEIMNNKFGTHNPIQFRTVDSKRGIDFEVKLRCNGVYSYKIVDPLLFYTHVCSNIVGEFTRDKIDQQLKTEFVQALGGGLAVLAEKELRPSAIALPENQKYLKEAMNQALAVDWAETRGIEVANIAMNPPTLDEEDMKTLQQMQNSATIGSNAAMMNGMLGKASADAMVGAANNSAGAMTGFMGMGFAQNAMGGGAGMNGFVQSAQQNQGVPQAAPAPAAAPAAAPAPAAGWKCPKCGKEGNTGKFCADCGSPAPAADAGWTCPKCGKVNKGKFCEECGEKKPEEAPLYKCDKCGWEPEDPHNPPKFCPQCGDPFDDKDKI